MGQIPTRMQDHYHLQKVKLGEGSFGTVWRAVSKKEKNVVAIKQLDKALMPKRGIQRKDVEREIQVMTTCQHNNITKLIEYFEDSSSVYLALEYCDGGDFGDKLKELGTELHESDAAMWMHDICSAICALHSYSICHRDVKPDNFMVAGQTLKLADFGLAVFVPRGKLLTVRCGTPAFMAPEQYSFPDFSRGYSFPVDVWAAGVTLSMLMNGGRHPFINAKGHLDERALLEGKLDQSGIDNILSLNAFHFTHRFSEGAHQLSKRMVEPKPDLRISAATALRCPWLNVVTRNNSGPGPRSPTKSQRPHTPRAPNTPCNWPAAPSTPCSRPAPARASSQCVTPVQCRSPVQSPGPRSPQMRSPNRYSPGGVGGG